MKFKFTAFLNYIQIFVCVLTAIVGAHYMWLPQANQKSVDFTIKMTGAPIFANILLVINPILGLCGEHNKTPCCYKVKFWLELCMMPGWIIAFYIYGASAELYRTCLGQGGKFGGFHTLLAIVNYSTMNETTLRIEHSLFIAWFTLTIFEFILLIISLLVFCIKYKCKCCCCDCCDIESEPSN